MSTSRTILALGGGGFTTPPGGLSHYKDVFTTGGVLTILGRSLEISVIVTVVSLLVGYPFAYVAATTKHRRLGLLMVGFAVLLLVVTALTVTGSHFVLMPLGGNSPLLPMTLIIVATLCMTWTQRHWTTISWRRRARTASAAIHSRWVAV